jgi:hypothetical protein
MSKKPIIIISVLCVISLGLGYLSGLKHEESLSNLDAGTDSKKEPDFLKEGLVAYYPFNGSAKDESGNGNDAEVFGPVLVSDRNQRAESAYNFDGINDYIDVGNIIQKLDDVTFSAWFLQSEISVIRQMNLVEKRRSPNGGGVSLWTQKGVVGGGNRSNFSVINSVRTDDEKWHHAVYSLGKKKMELFVDGVSLDVLRVKTGEAFSNENIWIGRGYTHDVDTGGNRAFKGFIDDVRMYNRALSAEEVKVLYEFEKAN